MSAKSHTWLGPLYWTALAWECVQSRPPAAAPPAPPNTHTSLAAQDSFSDLSVASEEQSHSPFPHMVLLRARLFCHLIPFFQFLTLYHPPATGDDNLTAGSWDAPLSSPLKQET